MRGRGSVTVFFSLVFLVLFSFIISFFEMAAYTARASYHASAALLATENYFAAFLRPLYEEYHIFGREVPYGEEAVSRSGQSIAEDVAYMTEKREGEKSLLLRSGAEFSVTGVSMLTDNRLEGFYSQAVTAMKYRGVAEVADVLKEFAGMTESASAHMEIAAAKAATDSAYAAVDEKILRLIELVDGVEMNRYEKFLEGKRRWFQRDCYVKFFCLNPSGAATYFDRTEVYQAFLSNHENPCETLDRLSIRAELLADEMEEREHREMLCRSRLAEIKGTLAVIDEEMSSLGASLSAAYSRQQSMGNALAQLVLAEGSEAEASALRAQLSALGQSIKGMRARMEQLEAQQAALTEETEQLEKEQKELEKKKKEQEKQAGELMKEEKGFVKRCEEICGLCDETYDYIQEIRDELSRAQKVKDSCETVLDALQFVIGSEAAEEYRSDLEEYLFYESEEGYDFALMKQTVLENKSVLWNVSEQIRGITVSALRAGVKGLQNEKETVKNYSFEGLRMDYGEMSLEEYGYDGVEELVPKKAAKGFLGFLTGEEISEKELDTSYLPSGFRYSEEEEGDIFSLLGTDLSGIFTELQEMLPKDFSLEEVLENTTDTLLFHSYLSAHFSDFLEVNDAGVLSYEQEYLIVGEDTDTENLSAVAMRICGIRTILHFISLYTDSTRKEAVEQAALAACGIIGLPALKGVLVFLLLFVWALEEAMIDTAACLQGKRLLLYPGKSGGSLSLPEIVLFSKEFILKKAKEKADAKGLAFGYHEYLHVFLFLTPKEDKKYRAADLIQENLRLTYRDSFRIGSCVWKLSYETDGKEYEYAYQ